MVLVLLCFTLHKSAVVALNAPDLIMTSPALPYLVLDTTIDVKCVIIAIYGVDDNTILFDNSGPMYAVSPLAPLFEIE